MHEMVVEADCGGMRLDVFLSRQLPSLSRRAAQVAIANGDVRINGRMARKGSSLRVGDRVGLATDITAVEALSPNPDLPISILYEDSELVAVDKPAGIATHALRPDETTTVANFLLARYPEMRSIGAPPLEAGLVHRLDTDTSGVLLAARTAAAFVKLRQQFREHSVTKEYAALVRGDVNSSGSVRTNLAHDPRNRSRMRPVLSDDAPDRGRPAVTHYKPRQRFGDATLLAVQIETGVMHQIRAHLASIGHPVIGDRLYSRDVAPAPRQLLHASRLEVEHPSEGGRVSISCPLPPDFEAQLIERQNAQRARTHTTRGARRN